MIARSRCTVQHAAIVNNAPAVPPGIEPIVHIVDDDLGLRTALDRLFRSVGYSTRLFGNAAEFMESGAVKASGCLILDVRLPGVSGLEFQNQLAEAGIGMPVILMTGHGDIPMSVRGMKAGAIDFLSKPFRDQDMLDAVAAALARDLATRANRQDGADLQIRLNSLSVRERQVMTLVSTGQMNKQVAHELRLSEITVKIHRGKAMRKMGARSLADLVKMATALKL
jgi:FixJ family two-component response regulator